MICRTKGRNCIITIIRGSIIRNKSYTSLDYCTHLVQKIDNENHICTLLLPRKIRTAAFAIRAFNAEIASVQDQVTQPHIGMMRFKFWEDSIEKIYKGKIPNNPVAVELSKAVQRHKLSKSHLKTIISCRARRIDQTSFVNVQEMEDHAEASCTAVFLLLLQAANIKSSSCDHVAVHCGRAQGLANLLRGIPQCAKHRYVSLPSDLLAQKGISEESVIRGTAPDSLREVVKEVTEVALYHLIVARSLMLDIPEEARSLFLPAVPAQRYLDNLWNCHFNVFDGELLKKNPFLPISLCWHRLMKTF